LNGVVVPLSTNADYLRALSGSVEEFLAAFEKFMALHVFNDSLARGTAPAVFPRQGTLPEDIKQASIAVAQAAGRATRATSVTGAAMTVRGVGRVDPIAAWQTITLPKPVLEPDDIVYTCHQVRGRLEAMILEAEADAAPQGVEESMHPLIWGASRGLWNNGHFRQAVAAASQALVAHVKSITGRTDVVDTAVWQQAFSADPPSPGNPRLRWPGNPNARDVRGMNDGLRQFAPGVQMVIRNSAVHGLEEMPRHEALECLATLSLLARKIEKCRLDGDAFVSQLNTGSEDTAKRSEEK
jgi:uncharacterized protein (TIGR02391 family)